VFDFFLNSVVCFNETDNICHIFVKNELLTRKLGSLVNLTSQSQTNIFGPSILYYDERIY
jgi:hypothetical protein